MEERESSVLDSGASGLRVGMDLVRFESVKRMGHGREGELCYDLPVVEPRRPF